MNGQYGKGKNEEDMSVSNMEKGEMRKAWDWTVWEGEEGM